MSRVIARWSAPLLIGLVCGLAPGGIQATDLTELYTRAREFDPRVQTAQYQLRLTEEAVRESRADLLPAISANAQASRIIQDIRQSDSLLFREGRNDYNSLDFSISLSQPIYHAGYNAAMDQARASVRQARFELIAEEQDLVFRVAQAHFDYLAALGDVEFTGAEAAAIERQLLETEGRLAAGLSNITAVHEGRARFALGQAAEIQAADVLDATRQAIAEITGVVPDDLKRLSESFPLTKPDRPEEQAWVEAAMFQNPRIKAAQAQAEVIAEDIRRQRGTARVPALDFVTVLSETDSGGSEFGGGRETANATLGLRLAIPIYDGGRASAAIRANTFRHRQALERVEAERRRAERETREAFQGVVRGITRVQALSQSVFFQEATVSEKDEGLRAGLGTGLAVLDARRDLFSARRDLARARYEYLLNSLRLKQSTGILSPDDLRQIDAFLQ